MITRRSRCRARHRDPERYSVMIQQAWCRETSADPDLWSEDNPALGQCAVTALVVQDLMGGFLVRAVNEGVSHYWNLLSDGTEVDLTRRQFERWEPSQSEFRSREYVLSYPVTAQRYALLCERLLQRLPR